MRTTADAYGPFLSLVLASIEQAIRLHPQGEVRKGGTGGRIQSVSALVRRVRRAHQPGCHVVGAAPVRVLREARDPLLRRARTMKHTASARFAITAWDEKAYSEGPGLPKMTKAAVTKTFTGDVTGEGHVEYLMIYAGDGTATFVGLERITGTIAGKSGSFVLQRTGVFEGGQATESYSVVAGSGTGELRGLRGEGMSSVGHGMEHPFILQYEFGG